MGEANGAQIVLSNSIHDRLPPNGIRSGTRDIFISEMVQDRDTVTAEDC